MHCPMRHWLVDVTGRVDYVRRDRSRSHILTLVKRSNRRIRTSVQLYIMVFVLIHFFFFFHHSSFILGCAKTLGAGHTDLTLGALRVRLAIGFFLGSRKGKIHLQAHGDQRQCQDQVIHTDLHDVLFMDGRKKDKKKLIFSHFRVSSEALW